MNWVNIRFYFIVLCTIINVAFIGLTYQLRSHTQALTAECTTARQHSEEIQHQCEQTEARCETTRLKCEDMRRECQSVR